MLHYVLWGLGILAAVYAVGFLYLFLRVLFENDHKFGCGPNMMKFWFGLVIGAVWPWLLWERVRQSK